MMFPEFSASAGHMKNAISGAPKKEPLLARKVLQHRVGHPLRILNRVEM